MPTWDQFMVPVLEVLLDGETRRLRDLYGVVADHVGLTADQRAEVISSGMLRHHDRIGWAASDLARAKAVERPSRGPYRITDTGRTLLREYPQGITQKELRAGTGHVPDAVDCNHNWRPASLQAARQLLSQALQLADHRHMSAEKDPAQRR